MKKELLLDIIQWDTENWGQAIQVWERYIKINKTLDCLEIGSQKGGLSLWAALNKHNVICSDLEYPEETAKPLHEKYEVTKNIKYESINALEIPYKEHFDLVFLKSILPSIGNNNNKEAQEEAIKSIYDSLKPGGILLFAENLTGSKLHSFARNKFTSWGSRLKYTKPAEINGFFNAFDKLEYKTVGFWGTFGRTEKQRRLLGKIDKIFTTITPKKWRYLVIGVAIK